MGEQLRILCIELGLNLLYQRVDVGASGTKFFGAEIIVFSELIASVVEDQAAV